MFQMTTAVIIGIKRTDATIVDGGVATSWSKSDSKRRVA